MPRKRLQKQPCDCVDCREVFPADCVAGEAVSRQLPPPKCLVLLVPDCFEAVRGASSSETAFPHLDSAISKGCSGVLALRAGGSESAVTLGTKALDNLCHFSEATRQPEAKGDSERNPEQLLRSLGAEIAFSGGKAGRWRTYPGLKSVHGPDGPGDFARWSSLIADRLGLAERHRQIHGDSADGAADPGRDDSAGLFLLCLDAVALPDGESGDPAAVRLGREAAGGLHATVPERLHHVDRLLQALNAHPGFQTAVLLVILLGISSPDGTALPAAGGTPLQAAVSDHGYSAFMRPRQSYEFAGLDEVSVDRHHSLLCIQRLPYVIRSDGESKLPATLDGFRPGHGCILAERLLPELAYKLGAAPKYGA